MENGQVRTCGTCSFCCKVLGIDELRKPPSVWCSHAEIGKGCKIYEDRPESCRVFRCLWLIDSRLPDEMRPDKTKVVFHVEKDKGRLKVNVDPDRPDAWKKGLVGQYIGMVRSLGVDVLIVCGLKKNLRTAYERELDERAAGADNGGVNQFESLTLDQKGPDLHPHPLIRDTILGR